MDTFTSVVYSILPGIAIIVTYGGKIRRVIGGDIL